MPRRTSLPLLAAVTVLLLSGAVTPVHAQEEPGVFAGPTPKAVCGPGSLPETGLQGRVPAEDVASGRADQGYYCNLEQVGFFGPTRAGWKTHRYHECAYYNAEPGGLPLGPLQLVQPGTYVLDVSDPTHPVQTDFLVTPAMQSPHESMSIDKVNGRLYSVLSNLATAPGILEIWDLTQDCKHPTLLTTVSNGLLGHEGNISQDGRTYYTGSLYAQTLVAVDVTNPLAPIPIAVENVQSHGMSTNPDGTRVYDTVRGTDDAGLVIYDTTEIDERAANATFKEISRITWPTKSTPQFAMHVTIKGKPYVIENDEFGGPSRTGTGPIGAARIIDISDETAPKVVSNIRLEVHMDEHQDEVSGDPRPLIGGPYTAHYCSVPSFVDPGIVACSMLRSGVRVFDIRDPRTPKEIAYYSPPVVQGTVDNGGTSSGFHTGANIEFIPERAEMWLTDQETGFHVVRFTNGVWPFTAASTPKPVPTKAPRPSAAPGPANEPLPTTGLPVGVAVFALAMLVTVVGARVRARHTA
jgi:hypothetical protein